MLDRTCGFAVLVFVWKTNLLAFTSAALMVETDATGLAKHSTNDIGGLQLLTVTHLGSFQNTELPD